MIAVLGALAVIAGIVGVAYVFLTSTTPVHREPASVPSKNAIVAKGHEQAAAKAHELARATLLEENLPGLSAAVAVNGEIVWTAAFGLSDLDTKAPMTTEHRFRIGSVSKSLTASAVGLLHERGKLDLDAPIQTYVPSFPKKQWPITLEHLMSHSAGLDDQRVSGEIRLKTRCKTALEAMATFQELPSHFQPGTGYHFSTFSWVLVSAAVESAAGETLDEFLQREVFTPLNMRDTLVDAKDAPNRTGLYHARMDMSTKRGAERASDVDYTCDSGGNFYLSTPSDLVRFGSSMLRPNVLKPETVKLLQTPVVKDSALGWFVETIQVNGKPTTVVRNGSSVFGGSVSLLTFPEHNLAVAVASNITFAQIRPLAVKIAEAFATTAPGK